jgi:hypothetical protein
VSTPVANGRHEQLESFLSRVSPFLDFWPSIDLRYSAIKQEGEWRNLFTRAVFSWKRNPLPSHGVLTLQDWFRAGRLTIERDAGIAWLRNLRNGRLRVEDIELRMDHVQTQHPNKPITSYGWTELRLDRTGTARGLNQFERTSLQGYVLQGNGGMAWELLGAQDWVRLEDLLFGLQHPYGGVGEFATSYLGFPEARTQGHTTAFEIVAPLDTSFLGWSISGGTTFDGRTEHPPTVQASDLGVAAILMSATDIDRIRALVSIEADTPPDQLSTSTFSFPWNEYRTMSLHLLLRGHAVDTLSAIFPTPGSPNPRFQALFALGRIGELITEVLDQPGSVRDSRRMELVVCWLLHMCGFQTIPTDQPSLTGGDVADLIAFDPYSNTGLVVEVTGHDPLSHEKLTKLRRRADNLAGAVASIAFYPVSVAVARDSFLETEVEIAKALSITLLGHTELQRLLALAQANELPANALRRLLSEKS